VGKTYRVVQWATGNIGTRALQQVIRAPELELAGVLVYDESKAGHDAGDLCGEPATGVLATTDRQSVIELGADCVLYMPRSFDVDDVVALLSAGTNVVTTLSQLFDSGSALSDADRQRVEEACVAGGTSAYATGSSPGFISETIPMALMSIQRRVDAVTIEEFADLSKRDSPGLLFEVMGFGAEPAAFNPNRSAHLLASFSPSLRTIGRAAGREVEEWTAHGEVAVAAHDVRIAAGEIPAGRVAAQRTRIVGSAGGEEVVSFIATWYCSHDLDPVWDLGATGWRVAVQGDAPLTADLPFPVPTEQLGAYTPGYTANGPVNAIPYVVQAPPGILRGVDLPPIVPGGPLI
jgi:4-hydroxy-tetrahydrodipicolinate reductase